MTDHTTCNSADLAVTRGRTRDTPNDRTLDASFGLSGRRKGKSENGGANDKSLHGSLQNVVLRTIADGHLRSDSGRRAGRTSASGSPTDERERIPKHAKPPTWPLQLPMATRLRFGPASVRSPEALF